jgi:hypothetical protein
MRTGWTGVACRSRWLACCGVRHRDREEGDGHLARRNTTSRMRVIMRGRLLGCFRRLGIVDPSLLAATLQARQPERKLERAAWLSCNGWTDKWGC